MIHLVVCILGIKKLLQQFVVILHDDVRSLEIIVPFGYGVTYTTDFLFRSAPFALSVHKCM